MEISTLNHNKSPRVVIVAKRILVIFLKRIHPVTDTLISLTHSCFMGGSSYQYCCVLSLRQYWAEHRSLQVCTTFNMHLELIKTSSYSSSHCFAQVELFFWRNCNISSNHGTGDAVAYLQTSRGFHNKLGCKTGAAAVTLLTLNTSLLTFVLNQLSICAVWKLRKAPCDRLAASWCNGGQLLPQQSEGDENF